MLLVVDVRARSELLENSNARQLARSRMLRHKEEFNGRRAYEERSCGHNLADFAKCLVSCCDAKKRSTFPCLFEGDWLDVMRKSAARSLAVLRENGSVCVPAEIEGLSA